ncbi:MAG: ABC transporter ATP-binding protein [Lachnospiraceae bacterium]|nr:ABC transporter ATP-binding protein [Lachnospiraceae bacterium]
MGKRILTVDNISKSYGDKHVLENINITLNQGELVSILGVSGVGKTTLFNVLSGLIMPDSGNVTLYSHNSASGIQSSVVSNNGNTDSDTGDEKEVAGGDSTQTTDITGKTGYLSYMLQKDLLLPHKTVIENAALPLLLNRMPKKKALKIAGEQFEHFGIEGTQYQYPAELSGGMRQRVALLRTYLCDKEVALLDEPFSALDTITRASMQQWYIDMMKDIKLSTLFITHDMDEAILLSDRIYILKGSPASIADEIIIDEPKPRNSEFGLTDKFLSYKKIIRDML